MASTTNPCALTIDFSLSFEVLYTREHTDLSAVILVDADVYTGLSSSPSPAIAARFGDKKI